MKRTSALMNDRWVNSDISVEDRDLGPCDPTHRVFENVGGVHLSSSVLWCDAQRMHGLNFLSSALAGDITKNRRFLCTEETRCLASRGRGKGDVLAVPYGQAFAVGELPLSVHPSGHLLGSAMVRTELMGRVVVYTGDLSTRDSATARPAEPVACDVLAMPASFGSHGLRFPPRQEVLDELQRFIEDTLYDKQTPVFLAQPMGVAQELVVELGRLGYRLRLHRSVAVIAKLYGELGIAQPLHRRFSKTVKRGEVVIFPPILRASVETHIPEAKVALVGPQANDATYVHQLRIDGAFALSNVADSEELLAFVQATGAEEVFLTGGDVTEFGTQLNRHGIQTHELLPPRQLTLFDR